MEVKGTPANFGRWSGMRSVMASVEYSIPTRRNPVVDWAKGHGAAMATAGCFAFWAAVGVSLYFIL